MRFYIKLDELMILSMINHHNYVENILVFGE